MNELLSELYETRTLLLKSINDAKTIKEMDELAQNAVGRLDILIDELEADFKPQYFRG